MKRQYRITPSERVGYGPGLWQLQYFDRDARVWFDIGDPGSRDETQRELEERRAGEAPN